MYNVALVVAFVVIMVLVALVRALRKNCKEWEQIVTDLRRECSAAYAKRNKAEADAAILRTKLEGVAKSAKTAKRQRSASE